MTTRDPLDELTISEIDMGSRLLRADLVGAVTEGTAQRWPALAIVAYLHARRRDPAAELATYRAMTAKELTDELGLVNDPDDAEQDAEVDLLGGDSSVPIEQDHLPENLPADPPNPQVEVETPRPGTKAAAAEIAEQVAANPTGRKRGS